MGDDPSEPRSGAALNDLSYASCAFIVNCTNGGETKKAIIIVFVSFELSQKYIKTQNYSNRYPYRVRRKIGIPMKQIVYMPGITTICQQLFLAFFYMKIKINKLVT